MNKAKNIRSLTVINLVYINVLGVAIILFQNRFNGIPCSLRDISFKNQFFCRRVVPDDLVG